MTNLELLKRLFGDMRKDFENMRMLPHERQEVDKMVAQFEAIEKEYEELLSMKEAVKEKT